MTGDETIQLGYKLMEEEDNEGWKQQEFTVPAEDTSFELSLQKLRGIKEGKDYEVRIRYFQRCYSEYKEPHAQMFPELSSFSPAVFGEWLPSKTRAGLHFKARGN